MVVLLKTIIRNLITNKVTTKRDIYYQEVPLFDHKQAVSDQLLQLLAHSLGTDLHLLNILPSQKGLMYQYGMSEPILIPIHFKNPSVCDVNNLKAVVIIEKDAVFKSLINHIVANTLTDYKQMLFVTGKGYPDNLTKQFIHHLCLTIDVPVLGFMDSDVYGSHIFRTYKYVGTQNILNNLRLMGCYIMEFQSCLLASFNITIRDFRLMVNFISTTLSLRHNSKDMLEIGQLNHWIRNTQRSMLLFKKAEMNVIRDNHSFLSSTISYILSKLDHYLNQTTSTA